MGILLQYRTIVLLLHIIWYNIRVYAANNHDLLTFVGGVGKKEQSSIGNIHTKLYYDLNHYYSS